MTTWRFNFFWISIVSSLWMGSPTHAQKEQAAEQSLEENTDTFQATFFEALKHKSIQNYDKAIALFLECRQLAPTNSAIHHELARVYFLDQHYLQAQEHAIKAVQADPAQYWYLETLMTILDVMSCDFEKIQHDIPCDTPELQENLATLYLKREQYDEAIKVLQEMGDTKFTRDLTAKIQDALARGKPDILAPDEPQEDNPVAQYKKQMETLLARSHYKKLLEIAKEALEYYPLQPYFYYAYGVSLHNIGNSREAIVALNNGLDCLLDDDNLANKIHKALAEAYNHIGNPVKANEYLNKIKIDYK